MCSGSAPGCTEAQIPIGEAAAYLMPCMWYSDAQVGRVEQPHHSRARSNQSRGVTGTGTERRCRTFHEIRVPRNLETWIDGGCLPRATPAKVSAEPASTPRYHCLLQR